MENPEAGAERRLVIAKNIPGEPRPGINVPSGWIVSPIIILVGVHRRDARLIHPAITCWIRGTSEGIKIRNAPDLTVYFSWVRDEVVAQSEIDRKSPRNFPVVLDEAADIRLPSSTLKICQAR